MLLHMIVIVLVQIDSISEEL